MAVSSILVPETISLREKSLKLLEAMLLTRFTDEKMSKLVRQNKGGTFHLASLGHEMIGSACGLYLEKGKDWGLPYYRDRAFAIGLGCDLAELFGAFLARDVPHHSGGRMMPEHFSHKGLNIPCQSSCVGSQFLQAVGVAKGLKMRGENAVTYVSAGDGATSQGDFHEALNFACLHKLNVLFVIQDNGWAISVPVCDQASGGIIADRARGYDGLSVHEIDGCDFLQVHRALTATMERGRANEGPTLIVAKVPRLGPHSSSDDPAKYKTAAVIEEEKSRDPLPRFEGWLIDQGWIEPEVILKLRDTLFEQVEEAARKADAMPFPEPASAADRVFAPIENVSQCTKETAISSSSGDAVVMMDALNHALEEEMQLDSGIVIFGQDVAHGKGGVFGITRQLTAKFGEERCFNSPLAESTIIGAAIGMSLVAPYKPVVEIQFADYMWTGINQLFNELASFYYRSNGEWNCPVVIRMPYGGYIQGGPYHSQSVEAFLCHCPGLKVVIPSNAADAKRLLKAAIRDPNPVVFLEHKALYRQRVFCARPEPAADEVLPLGKAQVLIEGSDCTVLCYGMMAFMAYEAAQQLKEEGISAEIIDLRTLAPLDMDTILTSVRKTGKVLIAHEAALTCGFGAELSAKIVESAFNYLDAPIMRLAGKDCMVPYCKLLEDKVLPQPEDVKKAIRSISSY